MSDLYPMPIHRQSLSDGDLNTWRVASYIRAHRIELVHSHSRRSHWVAAQQQNCWYFSCPRPFISRFPCIFSPPFFLAWGSNDRIDEAVADTSTTFKRLRPTSTFNSQ